MAVMTRTRFEVVPLTKHIGAELRGIDLRETPDQETVRAIYQAWLDHLVLIFPGQNLSQEDFIRVTGYFGELGELPVRRNTARRALPGCCPASCSSPTSARTASRSARCPTAR